MMRLRGDYEIVMRGDDKKNDNRLRKLRRMIID
jgi:hypothetical protein